MSAATKVIKLFYCYAREDQAYRERLEYHLAHLKRRYNLFTWADRQIMPGEDWANAIDESLNSADLILLLISPDFMASDYCYSQEMQRALERQRNGEATVLPILVRPAFLDNSPFNSLQVLPNNALPISLWNNSEEAFSQIAYGIEETVQNVLFSRQSNKSEEFLRVFYCYAREDKELRNYLEIHLKPLKRQFQFVSWHDQEIEAGKEWEKEIDAHIESAHIILLLISPHFMASDYCYTKQMKKALDRHKCGNARVIPILLRDVDLEDAPFYHLQVLPTDAIPVTLWSDRDAAFADIARNIRKVIKELKLR